MSVHWPIIRRLLATPTRSVIVDDRRTWRSAEILVAALHLADQIERKSKSWTVGVMLPPTGAFPAAALSAWMLGRTVVPLNFLLKPRELEYVLRDCETDIVVTAQPVLDLLGSGWRPDTGAAGGGGVAALRLEDVDFKGFPDPRWPAGARDDDLAALLYTSGTSGRPKGVMLTHGNLSSNVRQIIEWIDFTSRDTLLGVLPQFHSFGLTVLTLLPLTRGCRVVYSARFVPQRIVKLIRERRPTALVALPSMYNALLSVKDAGPEDFASLRFVVSGGEPLPEAVLTRFRDRFGVTINEGYGLTETAPVTNWCRPFEFRTHSVGKPLPGVDQRIIDPATGAALGPGQDGEVRMQGPNIMRGYFKLPAETAAAFDESGLFRTGDIGRFDSDGHLYITGRLKEMIIVGGENVFPREIEEVLNLHPSVKASGVIGMTDGVRGELPVAFVEMNDGAAFNEGELRAWCREHLAGYKTPRHIIRLDDLPRNPTGKIVRRELTCRLPTAQAD